MSNPKLAIYESASEPVIVVGGEGEIRFANSHAENLLGYAPGALSDIPVGKIIIGNSRSDSGDSREFPDADPKLWSTDAGSEAVLLAQSGEEIPVEIGLLPDHSGKYVVAVLRDIRGACQIREELEAAVMRFRAVAMSAADILLEVDLDSGELLWHGDVDTPLGFEPGGAPRNLDDWRARIHPDDVDYVRERIDEAMEKGSFNVNYRIRCQDGSYRYWESRGHRTSQPGSGRNTHAGALRDVTENVLARERTETLLAEAETNAALLESSLKDVAQLKQQLENEHAYLREEIKTGYNFDEIIGQSIPMKAMMDAVTQVAETNATVLLLGETGTGKELTARAIHSRSRRRDRALIKVDCTTLPSGLVESELFGHMKGSFTSAHESRPGRFELADGGTIFLDEIGELSADVQAKLLRVLQEGEIQRLGATETRRIDVRVIAATNRDLRREVEEGRFRADLYYRLNVFPIVIPPLRHRREDIPALTAYILSKCAHRVGKQIDIVSPSTQLALDSYDWPGNVRELQNVIERAVILSTGRELTISGVLGDVDVPHYSEPRSLRLDLEVIERKNILDALEQCDWKIKGEDNAASRLGLSPSTLRSRMKRLGIERLSETDYGKASNGESRAL
jgi:PAS domain S-box-containing protein